MPNMSFKRPAVALNRPVKITKISGSNYLICKVYIFAQDIQHNQFNEIIY
jgi:hypothetical protein